MVLLLFGTLFGCMAFGVPIVFSMATAGLTVLLLVGGVDMLPIGPQRMIAGLDSTPLLAIPFFFLAGELMNAGGITRRLIRLSSTLVGHVRGGLAYVVIVTNVLMAGISGSAAADAAATGSVLIPAMKKEGYSGEFSAAVTAAAATIGPIIPPSIPMIIFGITAEVSIGRLFLAGVLPGLLMGLGLMAVSYVVCIRRGYPASPRASLREFFRALGDAGFALVMPVVILGGIVGGIVTPTEAGAIAVAYALVVGIFVYRELRWRDLGHIFRETGVNVGTVMIILAAGSLFGWALSSMGVGPALTRFFLSVSREPWAIYLMINLFLLALGCAMDPLPALIIFVPVLMPLITQVGIDPVHFGLIMVLNLMIGLLTPPVGFLLYLTSAIAEARLERVVAELWPFLAILLVVLFVSTYWPQMPLVVPNLIMGK